MSSETSPPGVNDIKNSILSGLKLTDTIFMVSCELLYEERQANFSPNYYGC
jgi:hypothetical protein